MAGKPLHLLTAAWLEQTCESIAKNYQTASSSRELIRIIRALANYARLPSIPAEGIRIPRVQTAANGPRQICTSAFRSVFEAIDMLAPYSRAYYYTLLFTGFRARSARVMEWSLLKLEGEGAPTYRISDSAVRYSGGGTREMLLHPYLEAELRMLREHHVDRQLQSPPERQLSCPVDGGNCRVN